MSNRLVFSFLFFLLSSSCTFAQTPIQKLEKAYNSLMADPQTKYAITSLCVLDASTGSPLFMRNEQVGMAPASTLKVVTAATAFNLLGKDFQFQTTLAYTGNITSDGILKGNLVIVGGGDPTLGSDRYQNNETAVLGEWTNAIKKAGIKKIEGAIIGDDRIFGTQITPVGWTWQDIGNYFGAGASGLSWRDNQFDIHLRPGSSQNDETKMLKTVPDMSYLKIMNELKTGASGTGDKAYVFLPPYGNTAYLRGSWGLGIGKSSISAALPDPAFDCAYRLQNTLQRLGISTTQPGTTSRIMALSGQPVPAISQKISTITSPLLTEVVYWFLKKSVNLYGEALLKTLALKAGKDGSTEAGVETEIGFWASKGTDKNALNIIDGSGLSPANRVTTKAMADILFQVQKESWYEAYRNAFPDYNGMKIKSGTINNVSAFAGYHTSTSGKKYIIVININNYSGSGINKKLFAVLDALK